MEGSWCAVAPLGGCVFGAMLAAVIADRIGRKSSVLLLAPITIFSFIGMAFVKYIWYLSALRFIVGITEGAVYTILPMYVGEIVDPDIRGFLSSLLCIFYFVGTLFINCIGPFINISYSSLVVSIFPTVHFVTFLFMPESPYHYVKAAKYEDAETSLKKLKGLNNVRKEIDILKDFITKENESVVKVTFMNLFKIPGNQRACKIFFMLLLVSRLSGKYPIMLFTTTIFHESGSTIDPTFSVIIYNVIEVVVVTSVGVVLDKFGRRPLIMISGAGCCISMLSLGTYFCLKESGSTLLFYLNLLPISSLIVYNISYSIGLSNCPIVYLSELFPMTVKSSATCLAEISSVILGITVSQFFQLTYTNFGMSIPFFCFSLICCVGTILILRILPETKGKSLEEIHDILIQSTHKKNAL